MMIQSTGYRLAILCLLAVLLTSCSSAQPVLTPAPEDTFEPAPAVEAQKAKIAVSSVWRNGAFDAVQGKLNDALEAAGQPVEFEVQAIQHVDGKDSDDVYRDTVKEELAAGKPSADAFLLNFINSGTLYDQKLTMDLTELIPRNAPVYYSKYHNLFSQKLSGIPTGITNSPIWSKAALMLRRDFSSAGNSINTMEGFFGFINETIVKPKKRYVMLAYETDLVMQWALDNGYYPLNAFGIDGFLFCGAEDAGLTPVLLEAIPGFADFITAMKELRKSGFLINPFDPLGGKECIGFVYDLNYYYATSPYLNIPIAQGEFAAQLFAPDMPGYFIEPVYSNELIIPAVCSQDTAAAIVRFVEWMYADQNNYDSIVYGVKGVDFEDLKGRYLPLVAGKPLVGEGFEKYDGLFLSWPGARSLFNFDYFRLPATAPDHVEEFVADGLRHDMRFPLGKYIRMDRATIDILLKTSDEVKAVCAQRNDILYRLIQEDPAVFSKESLASDMESLGKLNNKWLCQRYKAIIDGLADRPK